MGNDLKKFGIFISKDWVALMSGLGSLVLAILGAIGGWPNGPPAWVFWAIAFLCLVVCAFRVWQKEYHEHEKAKEKIRTKLKIVGVAQHLPGDDHRRIMVHNDTSKTIQFRAKLQKTKPMLNYQLPVSLQPTHCVGDETIGEIGPGKDHPVDVFVDYKLPNTIIGLKLMGSPPCVFEVPRDQRLELLIGVYPVSEEGGSEERWFYMVPQKDSSVVFTADGIGLLPISSHVPSV